MLPRSRKGGHGKASLSLDLKEPFPMRKNGCWAGQGQLSSKSLCPNWGHDSKSAKKGPKADQRPSSAEFCRVLPSSAEFCRVLPSSGLPQGRPLRNILRVVPEDVLTKRTCRVFVSEAVSRKAHQISTTPCFFLLGGGGVFGDFPR